MCDQTSPYDLTVAVSARDRKAIALASDILRHAAGNFYTNDKPRDYRYPFLDEE